MRGLTLTGVRHTVLFLLHFLLDSSLKTVPPTPLIPTNLATPIHYSLGLPLDPRLSAFTKQGEQVPHFTSLLPPPRPRRHRPPHLRPVTAGAAFDSATTTTTTTTRSKEREISYIDFGITHPAVSLYDHISISSPPASAPLLPRPRPREPALLPVRRPATYLDWSLPPSSPLSPFIEQGSPPPNTNTNTNTMPRHTSTKEPLPTPTQATMNLALAINTAEGIRPVEDHEISSPESDVQFALPSDSDGGGSSDDSIATMSRVEDGHRYHTHTAHARRSSRLARHRPPPLRHQRSFSHEPRMQRQPYSSGRESFIDLDDMMSPAPLSDSPMASPNPNAMYPTPTRARFNQHYHGGGSNTHNSNSNSNSNSNNFNYTKRTSRTESLRSTASQLPTFARPGRDSAAYQPLEEEDQPQPPPPAAAAGALPLRIEKGKRRMGPVIPNFARPQSMQLSSPTGSGVPMAMFFDDDRSPSADSPKRKPPLPTAPKPANLLRKAAISSTPSSPKEWSPKFRSQTHPQTQTQTQTHSPTGSLSGMAPPPTSNTLDPQERAELLKKHRKLAQMFGEGVGGMLWPSDDLHAAGSVSPVPAVPPLVSSSKKPAAPPMISRSAVEATMALEKELEQVIIIGPRRRHSTPASPEFDLDGQVVVLPPRRAKGSPSNKNYNNYNSTLAAPNAEDNGSPMSFMEFDNEPSPNFPPSPVSPLTHTRTRTHNANNANTNTNTNTNTNVNTNTNITFKPHRASTISALSALTDDTTTSTLSLPLTLASADSSDLMETEADLERKKMRDKLAKLHRFLGSRVPIELALGAGYVLDDERDLPPVVDVQQQQHPHSQQSQSQSRQQFPVHAQGQVQGQSQSQAAATAGGGVNSNAVSVGKEGGAKWRRRRRSSSSAALPGYDFGSLAVVAGAAAAAGAAGRLNGSSSKNSNNNMDDKERALNVKRGYKMEQMFGARPPATLYQTRPAVTPYSTPRPSTSSQRPPIPVPVPVNFHSGGAPAGYDMRRPGTSESIQPLLAKVDRDVHPYVRASMDEDRDRERSPFAYGGLVLEGQNGPAKVVAAAANPSKPKGKMSQAYMYWRHSLTSLTDIIDKDDKASLAELHQLINASSSDSDMENENENEHEHEEHEDDNTPHSRSFRTNATEGHGYDSDNIPTPTYGAAHPGHYPASSNLHRLSTSTTSTTSSLERRRSLPARTSMTSLASVGTIAPPPPNPDGFQQRRRRAAKLTNFFGVNYRDLFGDVLESIERGMTEEMQDMRPAEAEELMGRLRKLKGRRDSIMY